MSRRQSNASNLLIYRHSYVTLLNFLSLIHYKTEFLIFGLPQQLSKLNNPTIHLPNNVDSARNLGVVFDKNLLFAQHISSIS